MMSSNSRTRVPGAEYQWSKTAMSQSAYGVSAAPGIRPGGGAAHVPCGSKKSTLGGSNSARALYVAMGSLRRSIVHSRPLKRCRYGACVSRSKAGRDRGVTASPAGEPAVPVVCLRPAVKADAHVDVKIVEQPQVRIV